MCIYIHTYIHTCMHTYIHTYTHTNIDRKIYIHIHRCMAAMLASTMVSLVEIQTVVVTSTVDARELVNTTT